MLKAPNTLETKNLMSIYCHAIDSKCKPFVQYKTEEQKHSSLLHNTTNQTKRVHSIV